jgi:hypothetical protein
VLHDGDRRAHLPPTYLPPLLHRRSLTIQILPSYTAAIVPSHYQRWPNRLEISGCGKLARNRQDAFEVHDCAGDSRSDGWSEQKPHFAVDLKRSCDMGLPTAGIGTTFAPNFWGKVYQLWPGSIAAGTVIADARHRSGQRKKGIRLHLRCRRQSARSAMDEGSWVLSQYRRQVWPCRVGDQGRVAPGVHKPIPERVLDRTSSG